MGMTPGEIMWERSVGAEDRTREIVGLLEAWNPATAPATRNAIVTWLKREYLDPADLIADGEEGTDDDEA